MRGLGTLLRIVAAVMVGVAYADSRACSCGGGDPDGTIAPQDYAAVFEGIPVVIARDDRTTDEGLLHQRGYWIRFRVFRVWHGDPKPFVWVHTGPLAGGCGIEFSLDERYLVFAQAEEDRLETGICQPTGRTKDRAKIVDALGAASTPAAAPGSLEWVDAARRFLPEVTWRGDTVVAGDFRCDGREDRALLGTTESEIVLAVFARGSRKPPEVLRYSAEVRDPLFAELVVESLERDPADAELTQRPGFRYSKTCRGLRLEDGKVDAAHIYWNHRDRKFSDWSR